MEYFGGESDELSCCPSRELLLYSSLCVLPPRQVLGLERRLAMSAAVVPTASDEHAGFSIGRGGGGLAHASEQLDGALQEQPDGHVLSTASGGPAQHQAMGVEMPVGDTSKRVKNYRVLASSFKYLQPFSRFPDGTYPAKTVCVLCAAAKPASVFFPCQHLCVCNKCINANDMSPEFSMDLDRCVCPVCRADVRLILPHTGTEEDAYWNWLQESEPPLPAEFTKGFKVAARRLSDSSVVLNRNSAVGSLTARPFEGANKSTTRLLRRASWTSPLSKAEPMHKLAPPKKPETCLIL